MTDKIKITIPIPEHKFEYSCRNCPIRKRKVKSK